MQSNKSGNRVAGLPSGIFMGKSKPHGIHQPEEVP